MFEFDVFTDPSLGNHETADLTEVATASGATVSTRTFSGSYIQITKARNLALMYGWPISLLRTN